MLLSISVFLNATYHTKYNSVINSHPQNGKLEITVGIGRGMVYNNSVGDDWFFNIDVNGEKFKRNEGTKTITVDYNRPLRLNAEVTESDEISAKGRGSQTVDISKLDFTKINMFSISVVVRENRGRYTGNTAEWEIDFNIRREMNFWEVVLY